MNLNPNPYLSLENPSRWLWSLLIFCVLATSACGGGSSGGDEDSESYEEEEEESQGYEDGTYCADIEYYNPSTGTRSDYTLNVEVEFNEVTALPP